MFGTKKKKGNTVTKDLFGSSTSKWAYLEKDDGDKSNLLGFGRKINQDGNPTEIKTPEKNLWTCLDKDGVDIGGVFGNSEEEAIINYVNCAIGASIFDKPVSTLVKGETRVNVSRFVVYVRLETGNLSGLNFMDKDQKNIPETMDIGLKLHQIGNYEGAINCYDWILQWDSQNIEALKNKVLTLDVIGK